LGEIFLGYTSCPPSAKVVSSFYKVYPQNYLTHRYRHCSIGGIMEILGFSPYFLDLVPGYIGAFGGI
jgi:hypothetical protein